jgi:hypothetical protein
MSDLLFERKYPTTKQKYVGIEIEFLLLAKDEDKLCKLLDDAKVQYNVHLGTDGSVTDVDFKPKMEFGYDSNFGYDRLKCVNIKDKYLGKEIRILATEKEAPTFIDKVCEAIRQAGGKINDTCGLHVHLDMRNREFNEVFNNFFFVQKLLFTTQPKTRRASKYCKIMARRTAPVKTKYYAINKMSYAEHRTLEIRLHQGTIDPKEIKMWTGLLIKIADTAKKFKKSVKSFDELELPVALKEYLDVRVKKYS